MKIRPDIKMVSGLGFLRLLKMLPAHGKAKIIPSYDAAAAALSKG